MQDTVHPQQINAFWSWVKAHQDDLDALESPEHPFWDELLGQLQQIDEGLWFEVSMPGDDVRELVITAEGDWELFPLVEAMVSVAPDLQGWDVVALKPAMGFEFGIRYEGLDLDPRKMWFQPLVDEDAPDVLGLRVAMPGFEDDQEQAFANGLLVILDTALGEKSAASDVDVVEVCEVPDDPQDEGFVPLPELASYVEWRKSRTTH